MRTVPKWVNKIHEADKIGFSSIHTICFSPDGTQVIVGAGEKVMVYDPRDGTLIRLLQAHKGPVYAVAYCKDGKKFASGSADKNVIIWSSKLEGILKYSHSDAIQCLAYNPVTYLLASCSLSVFAFWSTDVKAVRKNRVSGRITCCAWDHAGKYLAIGLANGVVSIRSKLGVEVQRIVRDAAVWAVTFSSSALLVTDWNDTLSFYNIQGQPVLKERYIGLSAVSISILGALILVGGVDGWIVLTSEGVCIFATTLDWVWSVAPSTTLNTMAVGSQDGTLWCFHIVFNTVHALHCERYAYRENMTDVIIQNLNTNNKARIKCRDIVQKIAIFKHRLAVQLPERVVLYEQADLTGMLYKAQEKINQPYECSLLVATSKDLLVCQDTHIMTIDRIVPKSWTVPTPIRYVKVTTLHFQEVLLLGLMNGQIWQVVPSTGVSKVLMQGPGSIRCLDVSASRGRIVVVDETSACCVYNLPSGELLFSEVNVTSVSWNSWCEEMLCLAGNGILSIKAGHFPPATQPLPGSVVGFQGGQVFCLQTNSMQTSTMHTIKVPLSHAVHQYIQQKMFNEAYAIACLGVTALDWERLGIAALEELAFEVARKAFQRSENIVFLTLIEQLQESFESGENRAVIVGEVLAYCRRHKDAARSFRSAGRDDRALAMFLDLRMFFKAQEHVGDGEEGMTRLALQKAEWAQRVHEPRAAAEIYLAVGDVKRATRLLAEHGRRDMLIELARKMDKGSSESLRHLAEALVAVSEYSIAADMYQRLGEHKKEAQLAVAAGEWARAFTVARNHADCNMEVYLAYAQEMMQENNFVEALKAYHMAGETATAMRVFSIMVTSAVTEERFGDVGHLHLLHATQFLDSAGNNNSDSASLLQQYAHNDRLARIYHAYDVVHRCVYEPFSLAQPDALFNAARYVLALLDGDPPPGVSMFCVYLCLAKQAKAINADILARQMLDKILGLQVPQKFQEGVELLMLKGVETIGSSGSEEDVAPLCWRCRRHLPPLAIQCPHCKHKLTHSMATHELLPLVRFEPAEGITHEEAMHLIDCVPIPEVEKRKGDGAEVFQIGEDIDYTDPFLDILNEEIEGPVICSRLALLKLSPACVVKVQKGPLPPIFYRNMLPELPITTCPVCQNLFYLEDYEIHLVTKRHCPFCRHQPEDLKKDEGSPEDSMVNGYSDQSSSPRSTSDEQNTWR